MTALWLGGADLELIQKLMDHLPDAPFFVKDVNLRYVAANRAMLRLCGLRRLSDLIGRTSQDIFPEGASRRYEALDLDVLGRGQPLPERLELTFRPGRSPVWLLFTRLPVRDAGGAVVGIAAVARQLAAADRRHPVYDRLATVVERLKVAFDQPLDLQGLSGLAGVSKAQLQRDFRKLFQLSPQQYQGKLRIDRALELLEGTTPIAQVAGACGYADQSAFTRRFHAAVGVTPTEFRRGLVRPRAPGAAAETSG